MTHISHLDVSVRLQLPHARPPLSVVLTPALHVAHGILNEHEFEQTPGDGERQGTLACCNPRDRRESDTTEQLNTT